MDLQNCDRRMKRPSQQYPPCYIYGTCPYMRQQMPTGYNPMMPYMQQPSMGGQMYGNPMCGNPMCNPMYGNPMGGNPMYGNPMYGGGSMYGNPMPRGFEDADALVEDVEDE